MLPTDVIVLYRLHKPFGEQQVDERDFGANNDASHRVDAMRNVVRSARLVRESDATPVHGLMPVDSHAASSGVVPCAIEQQTRYLPLCDQHTLLFNTWRSLSLYELVNPLIKATRRRELTVPQESECVEMLKKLRK